ncbi:PIG-P-domain-containing protein [Macroventuria anomochaeta]|uniref:PIG-P-domain-containing protein n=1 Tax=Macroventuria anomochaeta TaxID=301207 RepID=A0ACB6S885_9PLEO|nr:PIG-P-domain-containing protein [Macroventuria anomochaeta]KAF2630258.1 PIG-P-domain-containing protein [Macroventuria anomochaeta]
MTSSNKGQAPPGFQSKSTPNLPTLKSLGDARKGTAHQHSRSAVSPPRITSPRSPLSNGPASVEDDEEEEEEEEEEEDPFALEESEGSESGEEEAQEEVDSPPASRPLYTSRSYTHLPRQPATALYPPFYNRPPVPLPPSPSLTSLLRPAFSAATSRPTTPDSSDVELPYGNTNGTSTPTSSTTNLAHITNSARNAPTVPRASPKVPTYEYYGFAVYLGSSAAFLMYILWAYVPAPLLHQMGIWWYPDRWWALAVPCWLVGLVIYIYVALASYNTRYLTLPLNSCENLVDETAQVAVVDRKTGQIARNPVFGMGSAENREEDPSSRSVSRSNSFSAYQFGADEDVDWNSFWNVGTDAVMDVPIGGVCEILYGSGR